MVLFCGRCKHIGTYSIQADSFALVDESRDHTEAMRRLGIDWLRCEEKTCEIRLPLIETWSAAFDRPAADERRVDTHRPGRRMKAAC
jgi:hypothetical protein